MNDPASKYFLAIIPPEPVYGEAMALKEYFRDQHNSKGALRSPPHITLHMPFLWPDRKVDLLQKSIEAFSVTQQPVEIRLRQFGCFEPRVIFIGVESSEALTSLQKISDRFFKTELNVFSANYRDQPFHPHLTIAFRDLKKDEFKKAWNTFQEKKYEATFTAENFTLLRHDGKKWIAWKNFRLGKN